MNDEPLVAPVPPLLKVMELATVPLGDVQTNVEPFQVKTVPLMVGEDTKAVEPAEL